MTAGEWLPVTAAVSDGTICEIRVRDALGIYDVTGRFFLHDDGRWYRIDPPRLVEANVIAWRPTA